MSEFALMMLVGVLTSNVVIVGSGAVSLQSEKRSFIYLFVSLACTITATIVSGLLYSVINFYVLIPLSVQFLGVFVMVLLALVFAYIARAIVKVASKEQFYLYEKSYQFAIQSVVMVAVMLMLDFSKSFLGVMFQVAMFCVGFMLVQLLFYPLYERLDNKKTFKPARNVPLMLYSLCILALIFSAISMLF